jgi:hypothetical protein
MMVFAATLLVLVVVGIALLVAQPWDDGGADTTPGLPDVTDTNPGTGEDGTGGDGGTDGGDGSGGGAEQPAQ